MHFGYRLVLVSFHDMPYLLLAHDPAFAFLFEQARIRTKLAGEYAQVGRFDMEIPIEIRAVAVPLFPDKVRQGSQVSQGALFIQGNPLLRRDPLVVLYL